MASQQAPLAPAPRLIAAVAFIDRRGSLLYFRSFPLGSGAGGDHDPSSLELAIFGAVDYINEKLAGTLAAPTPARPVAPGPRPGAPASNDLFLGLLYPLGDLKLFGYAPASGLKIVVAVKDVLLREDRVRETFRALHRLYVDVYCNPFAPLDPAAASASGGGCALTAASPAFDGRVTSLVAQADRAIEYKGPMPL